MPNNPCRNGNYVIEISQDKGKYDAFPHQRMQNWTLQNCRIQNAMMSGNRTKWDATKRESYTTSNEKQIKPKCATEAVLIKKDYYKDGGPKLFSTKSKTEGSAKRPGSQSGPQKTLESKK